jgi:gamma-glutamyltranspeptidase/glutathione hydrolase/leukotriene-C4 hydrolase
MSESSHRWVPGAASGGAPLHAAGVNTTDSLARELDAFESEELLAEGGRGQETHRARHASSATLKHWLRTWPNPYCNCIATLLAVLSFALLVALARCLHGRALLPSPLSPPAPQVTPGPCVPTAPAAEFISVPHAAVAADDARCSAVGGQVLRDNGTAVDAAVATALCLGVTHPHSSGVGGGCFLVIYDAARNTSEVIDAREMAPQQANESMFVGRPSAAVTGGLAVAVPGELAGLYLAWQRHGALPWSRLVQPAAQMADKGIVVDHQLELAISSTATDIAANSALAAMLMPNGRPLRRGDTMRNPALAATLRDVAARGPGPAFYSGAAARAMAADAQAAGGCLTSQDFGLYSPVIREPLISSAMGHTIMGAPPPSSGGVAVALIASFLSGYPDALPTLSTGLATHRTAEAFKHAFAARMALGDPMDSRAVNNTDEVNDMISAAFAASLRAVTLDRATQAPPAYGGKWNPLRPSGSAGRGGYVPDDHGTTHLSVVDAARNAVALTSTVNTLFGSKVLSPSTGVLLNNEMDDFSSPGQPNAYGLAPSVANYIKPGKRPLSSMSPTLVFRPDVMQNGAPLRLRAVLGASGGPRIITATSQVLMRLLAYGANVTDAVRQPRIHHQLLPNAVMVEDTAAPDSNLCVQVPAQVVAALRLRRHQVNRTTTGAVVQAISVDFDTNMLAAVSDVRKGGIPDGY